VGASSASVRVHCAATGARRSRRALELVDNLDMLVAQIADRGLDPVERETYLGGVRKITYRDPDGNEFGFGDAPQEPA
jgi:hypothetical protein